MSYQGEARLSRHCGICGRLFDLLDRCVALIGKSNATSSRPAACRLATRPFCYPFACSPSKDKLRFRIVDGWKLTSFPQHDRISHNGRSRPSPESVTLHHDCFEVFRQAYAASDALDRLWTFALWRHPWREASRMFLPQRPVACSSSVAAVARRLGLAELARMPAELVCMVHEYCQSAAIWRLAAALDLAEQFRSTPAGCGIVRHGIRSVAAWERGQEPTLSFELGHLPIIRITIDALGVEKIERLPEEEPLYSKTRSNRLAYVIENQADIGPGRVSVMFKNGHARLSLPGGNPGFQTWDTPTLPAGLPRPHEEEHSWYTGAAWSRTESMWSDSTPGWSVVGARPTPTDRFHTMDLSAITGITFFFNGDYSHVQALHAHTRDAPFVSDPFFWRHTWVYVPISSNDKITAIAVPGRTGPHGFDYILFRTRLAGIIVVGSSWSSHTSWLRHEGMHILSNSPDSLIYNSEGPAGLSIIGAYPRAKRDPADAALLEAAVAHYQSPEPLVYVPLFSLYSSAPLRGVTTAEVFRRGRRGYTRGVLLTYEDGCQRALGECRVGVDASSVFRNPRRLCADSRANGWRNCTVKIQFHCGGEHGHDDRRPVWTWEHGLDMGVWKCFEMEGTLRVWFGNQHMYVAVEPEKPQDENAHVEGHGDVLQNSSMAEVNTYLGN